MKSFRTFLDFLSPTEQQMICDVADGHRADFEGGRQGTGYSKLDVKHSLILGPLIGRSLEVLGCSRSWDLWDAIIIRYDAGSFIPPHRDPPIESAAEAGFRHFRLNSVVRQSLGGVLRFEKQPVEMPLGWAVAFESDAIEHEVTPIVTGERLVWSVGCLKIGD